MIKRLFVMVAVLLLAIAESVMGQRVGVVLSGGGAKGLYHIGVLKALEEHGVPIDYISGTSMGAIIGSLYAAGYSPEEMEAIVGSGAVGGWVSGRIANEHRYYFREIGSVPPMITAHIGFREEAGRRKLQLPRALISSTQIDMALIELLSPASAAAGENFDHLFVPFRCIAADLDARRPITLDAGNLAEAVRASMSIPLAFQPLQRDSLLLYDGGVYDNFPWRAIDQEFHPELLIGAICTAGNTSLNEESGLIEQGLSLIMNKTDYTLPEGRGVIVHRAVPVGMLDFDRALEIVQMGYEDTKKQIPEIMERLTATRSKGEVEARRAVWRSGLKPLVLEHYTIEGVNNAKRAYARDLLRVDENFRRGRRGAEQRMAFSQFRDNLYAIVAGGDFSTGFPHVDYNDSTSCYSIHIPLVYKPSFKVMIGGNISSTAFNQAYIGVRYQMVNRVAQTFFGDLYVGPVYSSGTLGGRTDFFMWEPLFVDYNFNFSAKNLRHGAFGSLTDVTNTEQVRRNELFGSLGLGFPLSRRSFVSLRMHGGQLNYRYNSEQDPLSGQMDLTRFSYIAGKLELAYNTLDKPLYPTRGTNLSLSGIGVWGRDKLATNDRSSFQSRTDRQWWGARLKWDQYWDIASWLTLGFNFDAVATNQPHFSSPTATEMARPCYQPIPHSNMVYMPDFHAKRYLAGGLIPTFRFLPDLLFRVGFYTLYRDRETVDSSLHYLSEASLIYHTSLGPVSLSLTKYELDSWDNMYLTFNFGYAIFAPRGTFY